MLPRLRVALDRDASFFGRSRPLRMSWRRATSTVDANLSAATLIESMTCGLFSIEPPLCRSTSCRKRFGKPPTLSSKSTQLPSPQTCSRTPKTGKPRFLDYRAEHKVCRTKWPGRLSRRGGIDASFALASLRPSPRLPGLVLHDVRAVRRGRARLAKSAIARPSARVRRGPSSSGVHPRFARQDSLRCGAGRDRQERARAGARRQTQKSAIRWGRSPPEHRKTSKLCT